MTISLDKLFNCYVSFVFLFEISHINDFFPLNKTSVSLVLWIRIGAEFFYTRWCICVLRMSLSLPGSVVFCLFGTDQYVLLGSFWLTCMAWVKPPAVLEEPNSAIGLLDINQNMASPKGCGDIEERGMGNQLITRLYRTNNQGDNPLC